MVVTNDAPYTDSCDDIPFITIFVEAVCPEGKVIVAGDCETNPQIQQHSASVPQVVIVTITPYTFIQNNFSNPLPTSNPQSVRCRLDCGTVRPTGITGTLTAVAFCEQP